MRPQRKAVFILAGLVMLALLVGLLSREAPRSPVSSASQEASPHAPRIGPRASPPLPAHVAPGKAPTEPRMPPIASLPPPQAPVIESISFDKPSVCFNEEVLITVQARTSDGREDPFLRYRVAGEEGPVVSLRRLSVPSPRGGPPERGGYTVTVSGREGTHVTVPLPSLEVKDCRVPDEFELVHALEPGTQGVVRLIASPVGHNPDLDAVREHGVDDSPPFVPVRYVWSFGDGTTAETHEDTVVHDFGSRPQTTLYSYFLVTCEAFDARGRTLTARKSLELKNPAFEAFATRGTVLLLAQPLPAEEEAPGRFVVPIRLWHPWRTPITVTSVRTRRHPGLELHRADERAPPSTPPTEEVLATAALGTSQIPPGGVLVPVRFDPEHDRDIAAKEFRIDGETSEGWPVKGRFMAVRPGLDPVDHRMLVDGEWRLKVLRARAHLREADVSAQEVMDLEGQGLYGDLPRAFQGTPPPGFAPPESTVPDEEW